MSPLPFPLLFVVSQAELLVVLQLQSAAAAVIFTLPAPAVEAIAWLADDNEYVHATPAWFTVYVLPATVIVPDLAMELVLANTVKFTVPLPVLFGPEVTAIHAALLATAQGQVPVFVVTVMLPLAPPAIAFDELELIEYVQPEGWLTVNVWSATVIVPERAGPVFSDTE